LNKLAFLLAALVVCGLSFSGCNDKNQANVQATDGVGNGSGGSIPNDLHPDTPEEVAASETIELGIPQAAILNSLDDIDLFHVDIPQAGLFHFHAEVAAIEENDETESAPGVEVSLRLISDNWEELSPDLHGEDPTSILFAVPEAGTYFVEVTAGSIFSALGDYTLTAEAAH